MGDEKMSIKYSRRLERDIDKMISKLKLTKKPKKDDSMEWLNAIMKLVKYGIQYVA